jgi:hypothetical protein
LPETDAAHASPLCALVNRRLARSNPEMRHARAEDLDRLEPLLARLRRMSALKEKSRGVFYRGSRAYLHFHEDASLLFADVRLGDDFKRMAVSTADERKRFLAVISSALREPK